MKRVWMMAPATLLAAATLAWGQPLPPTTLPPGAPPGPPDGPPAGLLPGAPPGPVGSPGPSPYAAAPEQLVPHAADEGGPAHDLPAGGPDLMPNPYRERIWFDAEYLLWWFNRSQTPTLAGTVPESLARTGSLPSGAITPVLGDNSSDHAYSGGRFTLGGWLDCDQCIGLEGSFFFLEPNDSLASRSSSPGVVLGPTFFDPTTNRTSIIVPNDPATSTEHATWTQREHLWGGEANLRSRVGYFGCNSLDVLLGFREVALREDLSVSSNQTGPAAVSRLDQFTTSNYFAGAQVGAAFDFREGPWDINVTGKIAFGGVREMADIHGLTTVGGNTLNAGVLALPSNSGHFVHYDFTGVPELTVKGAYYFTENIRLGIGYDALALLDVHRLGDAIDDSVNPRNIPNVSVTNPSSIQRPVHTFGTSELRAQGLTFDLEIRY
jgi:hypothetical protein